MSRILLVCRWIRASEPYMRLLIFLLCARLTVAFCLPVFADSDHDPIDLISQKDLISGKLTNAVPLVEGPNDGNIAKITSTILENGHYLRLPFNDDLSSKFLDRF